jgi:hypothetical protein
MRLLNLVAVVSLALATPGCTFIGAGIGASVPVAPVSKDNDGKPTPPNHASGSTHTLLGAGIGLFVDIIVVSLIANSLAKFGDMFHYHNSCPGCD